MAKETEFKYNPNASAKCQNCNSVYTLGMTVDSITLEICGNCHPFYTGKETLIDTAGRIEKFKARQAKTGNSTIKSKKTKQRKTIQTLADLTSSDSDKINKVDSDIKKAPPEKIANAEQLTKKEETVSAKEVNPAPITTEATEE